MKYKLSPWPDSWSAHVRNMHSAVKDTVGVDHALFLPEYCCISKRLSRYDR